MQTTVGADSDAQRVSFPCFRSHDRASVWVRAPVWRVFTGQRILHLMEASSQWVVPITAGSGLKQPPSGLWILVVDAESLEETLAALSGFSCSVSGGPLGAVAVVDGLDDSGLRRLIDLGVNDFVCESRLDDELQVRCAGVWASVSRTKLGAPTVQRDAAPPSALRKLIGQSPAFLRQIERIPLLARYEAGVLISGDTGTGKEVCAQAIHYASPRAGKPWVAINCGAIPTELVESELFGHVKGAYTHAHAARSGLVREAEGGTLFLDEIDALPYGAQAALLRFLQEKEFRPVGANLVLRADVRVIAASNRQLGELAARGKFRQDLFFRLNVLTLHLPALRERREDIPLLASFFLRAAASQWGCALPALSQSAVQKLLVHDWPGNVRELKNVVERSVLMAGGRTLEAADIDIDGSELAPDERALGAAFSFRAAKAQVVENFERNCIQQLLASNGGNVTQAARAAKKNRRAFFELMRKYRIEPATYRESS